MPKTRLWGNDLKPTWSVLGKFGRGWFERPICYVLLARGIFFEYAGGTGQSGTACALFEGYCIYKQHIQLERVR